MNIPKEITTPPEGYEWTGEVRIPEHREPWAAWTRWGWEVCKEGPKSIELPILRKIKPPTVMVPTDRSVVESHAKHSLHTPYGRACREALEREENQ